MKLKSAPLIRLCPGSERGSLALEHVLFIGAVVALSAGVFVFYDNLSNYFKNITFASSPTSFGSRANSTQSTN